MQKIGRCEAVLHAILALAIALPAHADQVIGIADGDTLTVLHAGRPLKVRLADIDAPEKRQPWGQRSKQSLSDLCFKRDAQLYIQTVDKYGRTVARVTCAGTDANRAQVERGMAWVYDKYNLDASLPAVQAAARSRGAGLWADPVPVPPWEFRHAPKVAAHAGDAECHTGPRGGRYQLVDGRKRYGC